MASSMFSFDLASAQEYYNELAALKAEAEENLEKYKQQVEEARSELETAKQEYETALAEWETSKQQKAEAYAKECASCAAQGKPNPAPPDYGNPPSREGITAAEAALAEAEQNYQNTKNDIEMLGTLMETVNKMITDVKNTEQEVTIFLTSELINLANFSNETATNIINALGNTADSVVGGYRYIKDAAGNKVYVDVYADDNLSINDYSKLVETMGLESVIRLMTAQGCAIEMMCAVMGQTTGSVDYEQVKAMSAKTECFKDVNTETDIKEVLASLDDEYAMIDGVVHTRKEAVAEVFNAADWMQCTGERDCVAGIPVDYSKTTYTDATAFNWDEQSYQAGILNDETTYIDENGLYRTQRTPGVNSDDDYYCVAMGAGFFYDELAKDGLDQFTNAGYTFQVEITNENGDVSYINVILADAKGDSNSYVPHDHPVEFEVDGGTLSNDITTGGNVDYGKLLFGGGKASVTRILSYEQNLFEGDYTNGFSRVEDTE